MISADKIRHACNMVCLLNDVTSHAFALSAVALLLIEKPEAAIAMWVGAVYFLLRAKESKP